MPETALRPDEVISPDSSNQSPKSSEPAPKSKKKSISYYFWYGLLGLALLGILANIVISGLSGEKIKSDIFQDTAIILAAIFAVRAHQVGKSKLLCGAIGFAAGIAVSFVLVAGLTAIGNKKYGVQRMLKSEADKLRGSLPKISADGQTQILSVETNEKTLTFKIKLLNDDRSDLDTNTLNEMHSKLKSGICKAEDIVSIINSGAEVAYTYIDKANAPVLSVVINKSACEN